MIVFAGDMNGHIGSSKVGYDGILGGFGYSGQVSIRTPYVSTCVTNQPPLSSITESRRLTFFVHLARTDENADASQAIFEPPPENDHRGGRAQPG